MTDGVVSPPPPYPSRPVKGSTPSPPAKGLRPLDPGLYPPTTRLGPRLTLRDSHTPTTTPALPHPRNGCHARETLTITVPGATIPGAEMFA
ncbi:hypothetical protein GCM10010251_39460 [Streptomyces aurantiogriseus]|uniref:Uncharacterized protein n=1 Tax=Streptomyces aurantiogriseus TaxID=66870 RepID=A0A918FBL0_9ACTN|nr:hypothetical protein GCM10010251_39460 [Streptomyces aurantiogriseus]